MARVKEGFLEVDELRDPTCSVQEEQQLLACAPASVFSEDLGSCEGSRVAYAESYQDMGEEDEEPAFTDGSAAWSVVSGSIRRQSLPFPTPNVGFIVDSVAASASDQFALQFWDLKA